MTDTTKEYPKLLEFAGLRMLFSGPTVGMVIEDTAECWPRGAILNNIHSIDEWESLNEEWPKLMQRGKVVVLFFGPTTGMVVQDHDLVCYERGTILDDLFIQDLWTPFNGQLDF